MRVLLTIHHHLDRDSGAPGATLSLAKGLEQLGVEVAILSFDDLPQRLPALAKEALFPEFVARELWRSANRYDVVDAATGDAWLWALGRRRSPTLVTRSHGLEHIGWQADTVALRGAETPRPRLRTRLYHGWWRLREVELSLALADACVFLNSGDRQWASERFGIEPSRCFVVGNGLRDELLAAAETVETGDHVAIVGSWNPRKGCLTAATAMSKIAAHNPRARFRLLGTVADERQVLSSLDAQLRPRVTVIPRYQNVELPQLLAGCGVIVAPSLAEGFNIALREAAACGLAPVASDIPAHRDFVEHGDNGLLFPAGDADALARQVLRVLDDPELRKRLAERAARQARALRWRAIAERNLQIYRHAATLRQPRKTQMLASLVRLRARALRA